MKKVKGFSILELIVVLSIMGLCTPILLDILKTSQQGTYAAQYADQTKTYAKAFSRIITDNYGTYYKAAIASPTAIQVIPFSTLIQSGYLPAGMQPTNLFGQSPCVAMQFNSQSNQLQAIMFYSFDASKKNLVNQNISTSAMMKVGGAAGVVMPDNSILGAGKGWLIPSGNQIIGSVSGCDLKAVPQYSLAMNLSMLPDLTNNMQTDPTLHRSQDNLSGTQPGDSNNLNTMQTDLTLQTTGTNGKTSGIYLTGSDNQSGSIFLGSGATRQIQQLNPKYQPNDVVLANGNMQAQTLKPTLQVQGFQSCSSNQIGQTAADGSTNSFIKQAMICTQNKYYCSNAAGNTCYLPLKSVTIQYHPNSSSGFDCSATAGVGFYIVPNSATYQTNQSGIVPDKSFCSLQWSSVVTDGSVPGSWTNYYTNNSMAYSIMPMQHYEWVGCSWGTCCSFRGQTSPIITAISCTNDTSTFSTQGT